jgi:hypothetical protein
VAADFIRQAKTPCEIRLFFPHLFITHNQSLRTPCQKSKNAQSAKGLANVAHATAAAPRTFLVSENASNASLNPAKDFAADAEVKESFHPISNSQPRKTVNEFLDRISHFIYNSRSH